MKKKYKNMNAIKNNEDVEDDENEYDNEYNDEDDYDNEYNNGYDENNEVK